jgi:hypothetical protein
VVVAIEVKFEKLEDGGVAAWDVKISFEYGWIVQMTKNPQTEEGTIGELCESTLRLLFSSCHITICDSRSRLCNEVP